MHSQNIYYKITHIGFKEQEIIYCVRMTLTFFAHAYGLAFTEATGLTRPAIVFSYNAFIQERTVELCCPLYSTSEVI